MVAMRDMVLSLGKNGESASREMEELAKTNHSSRRAGWTV